MAADIVHSGHIRLIQTAAKYGEVLVGLLTDEAIEEYKRVPVLPFKERKTIVENLRGVGKVMPQKTFDYVPNLRKVKPDYVVHADDWRRGVQKSMRERVLGVLKEWGGRLIEPPYTKGISSSLIIRKIQERR